MMFLGKIIRKLLSLGMAYSYFDERCCAAPMTMIRDYVARFGRVVLVDEYLTSQVCSGCHKRMEQSKVEHGVFHCKSDCCKLKTTWDRDIKCFTKHCTYFC